MDNLLDRHGQKEKEQREPGERHHALSWRQPQAGWNHDRNRESDQ
jgi:hypothetical protein